MLSTSSRHKQTSTALPATTHGAAPASSPSTSQPVGTREALLEAVALHLDCSPDSIKWQQERRLQSLWAGYGTVSEVTVAVAASAGGRARQQAHKLILKRVTPPADSGVSHQRKLKSYQVEAFFYRHLAQRLLAASPGCSIAAPLYAACDLVDSAHQPLRSNLGPSGSMALLLTDLRSSFPHSGGDFGLSETKAALRWLAAFHEHFWEAAVVEVAGVWDQGCYWHLDTRQEEYEAMGPEWHQLRELAPLVDRRLKGYSADDSHSAAHRTLVHGDFKPANLLFSRDRSACAAYDFQYCGGGYGVRDVAYLLSCGVQRRVVEQHEQELLAFYHQHLTAHLGERGKGYTVEVMQQHYSWALVDYVRFMAGWGMWGNARWAVQRCQEMMPHIQ